MLRLKYLPEGLIPVKGLQKHLAIGIPAQVDRIYFMQYTMKTIEMKLMESTKCAKTIKTEGLRGYVTNIVNT